MLLVRGDRKDLVEDLLGGSQELPTVCDLPLGLQDLDDLPDKLRGCLCLNFRGEEIPELLLPNCSRKHQKCIAVTGQDSLAAVP